MKIIIGLLLAFPLVWFVLGILFTQWGYVLNKKKPKYKNMSEQDWTDEYFSTYLWLSFVIIIFTVGMFLIFT